MLESAAESPPKLAFVLVQAGPEHGWHVLVPGAAEALFFPDLAPALSYAKDWASANRPTTMRVRGQSGNFTQGWSFR